MREPGPGLEIDDIKACRFAGKPAIAVFVTIDNIQEVHVIRISGDLILATPQDAYRWLDQVETRNQRTVLTDEELVEKAREEAGLKCKVRIF